MTIGFLFLALAALLLIGTPIGIALGLSSIATALLFTNESLASMAPLLFDSLQHQSLLAIPFLVLTGALLSTGGMAQRIVRFAVACFGHLRGGLAIASVPASMAFAALAGASPVAVMAVGSIMIAGMVRAGYRQGLAAGVIGNAAAMGVLIPPSIVMVIYAAVTDGALGRLFLAAAVPAITVALALMAALSVYAWITGLPRQPRADLREVRASGRAAIGSLLPIAIVMGGVCSGLLAASQAAAIAAAYAFVLAVLIARDIGPLKDQAPYRPAWADWEAPGMRLAAGGAVALLNLAYTILALPIATLHRDVRGILVEAARITTVLMFIFINASLFAQVLTSQQVPLAIAQLGLEPWMLLAALSVILLLVGQIMEPAAMVMVAAPLFPLAMTLGLDPIHLAVVVVVSVEIAMMMPPAGLNLFMIAGMTGTRTLVATKAALPWLGILLLFLAALIAFPRLATFLPDLVYGPQVH